MNARRAGNLSLAETAAGWVVRRRGDTSPECNAEFMKWLKESPRHIDEYLAAAATIAALRRSPAARRIDIAALVAETSSNVFPMENVPLDQRPPTPSLPVTRRKLSRWHMGATAAAAFVGIGAWFGWNYLGGETYATAVGEQRMVRLADGSVLHLNTHSRVRVQLSDSARELRLLSGEAFFTVAQDPARPFRVMTDTAAVQAVGTEFNVYRHGEETRVAVLEGRVRVTARDKDESGVSGPALLDAGEQAQVTRKGGIAKVTTPLDSALAWRERRLIFWGAPLAEVAEQFNRYNDDYRIRIDGDALARREIWGVFRVDQPQALVKFLQNDDALEVQPTREGLTVRRK